MGRLPIFTGSLTHMSSRTLAPTKIFQILVRKNLWWFQDPLPPQWIVLLPTIPKRMMILQWIQWLVRIVFWVWFYMCMEVAYVDTLCLWKSQMVYLIYTEYLHSTFETSWNHFWKINDIYNCFLVFTKLKWYLQIKSIIKTNFCLTSLVRISHVPKEIGNWRCPQLNFTLRRLTMTRCHLFTYVYKAQFLVRHCFHGSSTSFRQMQVVPKDLNETFEETATWL